MGKREINWLGVCDYNTSRRSQFYITFKATSHLDKKHTVFGKLVGGEDVLDALEKLPVKPGTDRPGKIVKITEVIMYVDRTLYCGNTTNKYTGYRYQDPFEDYKTRHAKKLARRAEGTKMDEVAEKEKDDVNWFGLKVGSNSAAFGTGEAGGGGVGKYMSNLKRPVETPAAPMAADSSQKKRKLGFGDFTGW